MAALFDPVHRRGEGIKWGLVSYTVVLFSIVTVFTVTSLAEFPSTTYPPIPNIMLLLNYWLADGLLVGFLYLVFRSSTFVSNASPSSSTVVT